MASSSSQPDEPLTPNQRIAAKDWCFTIFPPRGEILLDLEECQRTITQWPFRYIVYQIELCPTTGREHLQGFVQWEDKQRLSALKKFHATAHWEKRRGTPYEAAHYCKKPVEDCTCKHCDGLERYDPRIFEEGFMSVENQHRFHEVVYYHHSATPHMHRTVDDSPFHPRVNLEWGPMGLPLHRSFNFPQNGAHRRPIN